MEEEAGVIISGTARRSGSNLNGGTNGLLEVTRFRVGPCKLQTYPGSLRTRKFECSGKLGAVVLVSGTA